MMRNKIMAGILAVALAAAPFSAYAESPAGTQDLAGTETYGGAGLYADGLSDDGADAETASDWEETLPEELSGVYAEDLVAVAESQVGYRESEANYRVDADGSHKGYTRYGEWAGEPYGSWNAEFAAFCLSYAGIPEEDMPVAYDPGEWAGALAELGMLEGPGYEPEAGDLVFFYGDDDGAVVRVGIVTGVGEAPEAYGGEPGGEAGEDEETDEDEEAGEGEETGEGPTCFLNTIEGDCDGEVREQGYGLEDGSIASYCTLPEEPEGTCAEEEAGEEACLAGLGNPERSLTEDLLQGLGSAEDDGIHRPDVSEGQALEPDAGTAEAENDDAQAENDDVQAEEPDGKDEACGVKAEEAEAAGPMGIGANGSSEGSGNPAASLHADLEADGQGSDGGLQVGAGPEAAGSVGLVLLSAAGLEEGAGEAEAPDHPEGTGEAPVREEDEESIETPAQAQRTPALEGEAGREEADLPEMNGATEAEPEIGDIEEKPGGIVTLADGSALLAGSYTLTSGEYYINSNTSLYLVITGDVTLDLNGYSITPDRNNYPIIYVNGGTLTLKDTSSGQNGKITEGSYNYGGAVCIGNGGTMIMESGNITGNTCYWSHVDSGDVDGFGGGVYVYNGYFEMRGGSITDNNAFYGGGVSVSADGSMKMTGGEISGNWTVDYEEPEEKLNIASYGGGICVENGGKLEITGGKVSENLSASNGGGIGAYNSSTIIISGGEISENKAWCGGGILTNDSTLNMTGGSITVNEAAYYGGGIELWYSETAINISGGTISGNSGYGGGGIDVWDGATATISGDAVISDNEADYGGGILVWDDSTLNMTGGSITGNEAAYGGGIYGTGEKAAISITNEAMIAENQAHDDGGGIYAKNVSLSIDEATVKGNFGKNGGGIYAENVSLSIDKATVKGNFGNWGGGLCLTNISSASIANSTIQNNWSLYGGGISAYGTSLTIDNCKISGNTAEEQVHESANTDGCGGGIYADDESALTIKGDTEITGNTAYIGGGLYIIGDSSVSMKESKVMGNTAERQHNYFYDSDGGGIHVDSGCSFEADSCVISGNSADFGGGISAYGASVSMNSTTLSGNKAYVNGTGVSSGTYGSGGGIYIQEPTSESMTDMIISRNTAVYGGGVYATSFSSELTLTGEISSNEGTYGGGVALSAVNYNVQGNTEISSNTAEDGGGIITLGSCTLSMSGGTVSNNTATAGAGIMLWYTDDEMNMSGGMVSGNNGATWGGGIDNYGTLTLSEGTITGNSATYGGGVYQDSRYGTMAMSGGTVTSNSASCGGGFYNCGTATSGLSITNGTISQNTAKDGGGIYNDGSLSISGGSITENTATWSGGIENYSTLTMTGGSITNNSVSGYAGGIWQGGTMSVSGSPIVTGNTANGSADNVYVGNGKTITLAGSLDGTKSIGITTYVAPTASAPVQFTDSGNSLYTSSEGYFFSDNETYYVRANDTGKYLELAVPEKKAFAVYSVTDNSLTFYYGAAPDEGETYNGKAVTNVYTGFETETWNTYSSQAWYAKRTSIKTVSFDESFATVQPVSMAYWFYEFTACTEMDLANLDTSEVTTMNYMFCECSGLTSLDVSKFNTSNVTTMSSMFYECTRLTSLDVSKFNTSKVTNMSYMFYNCSSLQELDISNFDTSSVTSYNSFATQCTSLDWIKIGDDFDLFTKSSSALVTQQYWYDSNMDGKTMSNNFMIGVNNKNSSNTEGKYWTYTSTHATLRVDTAASWPEGYAMPDFSSSLPEITLQVLVSSDGSTNYYLGNSAYEILDSEGNVALTGTTDETGYVTVTCGQTVRFTQVDAEYTSYIVQVTNESDGWYVHSNSVEGVFEDNYGETSVNTTTANLVVTKKRSDDITSLDTKFNFYLKDDKGTSYIGAAYYLYDKDNRLISTSTGATDSSGNFTLEAGQTAIFTGMFNFGTTEQKYVCGEYGTSGYSAESSAWYAKDEFVTPHIDFTNTQLTTISVAKTDADQPGSLLSGATFTIYKQDGTEWSEAGEATTNNSGVVAFTNASAGTYRIVETGAPDGYQLSNEEVIVTLPMTSTGPTVEGSTKDGVRSDTDGLYYFYNLSYTFEDAKLLDINVNVVWDDNDDSDGLRPESVTVCLLGNDEEVEEMTLDRYGWESAFSGLPRYDSDGREITYTVKAALPDNVIKEYTSSIVKNSDGSFTITYTHTPETTSVPVYKFWEDDDDRDGLRPASVEFSLYLGNSPVTDETGKALVLSLTEADGWKGEFAGVAKYHDGGIEYEYEVKETAVSGYGSEMTKATGNTFKTASGTHDVQEGAFVCVNTHEPETRTINVAKEWDDADNLDGIRPDSVSITLLADGQEAGALDLSQGKGWEGTFTVPVYANHGTEITYTVTEKEVSGYTGTVGGGAEEGFVVTNTHTPTSYSVSLNKVDTEGKALSGAEFTVSDKSGTLYFTESGGTYTACGSSTAGATSTITAGSISLEGLTAGQYTLTETKAPDGYNLPDTPVVFTVSSGGITVGSGRASAEGYTLNVTNATGTVLPYAGGVKTLRGIILGSAVICTGMAGVVLQNRRRRAVK